MDQDTLEIAVQNISDRSCLKLGFNFYIIAKVIVCAFQNIYQAFATAHRYLNVNVSCMYMKTRDSASPGSAIKLNGIVSYLIAPLKMFIYGKNENNLRR